jgi:type II secretory pathway pseudopilin PulG
MSYEATPDFTNSAPIILFTVEGDDSADTAAALDELMGRVPQILDDLQGGLGLPQADLVTARKLTQDSRPAVVRKSQIRAALLATAVTGGLGLLLLALVDSLLGVRARSRAERKAAREAEAARRAEEEAAAAPPEPVDETSDEDAEEDEPIYTYRIPIDSDLAISPARSKWLHTARSSPATRDGHRFRDAPPTKPRSRASGRNR